jgi:hypothetical protein
MENNSPRNPSQQFNSHITPSDYNVNGAYSNKETAIARYAFTA